LVEKIQIKNHNQDESKQECIKVKALLFYLLHWLKTNHKEHYWIAETLFGVATGIAPCQTPVKV
jgi:hypothetical protein